VAPDPDTRRCADQAAERLFRGVVAASSTVETDVEPSPSDEADADAPTPPPDASR
jgi:hypothetical protein